MIIPEDQDQRNIIDKLANFVARNGPKFEDLTKEKQRENPKFQFLYGGEHHAYYKWKVLVEGQQMKAQEQSSGPAPAQQTAAPPMPSWQQAVQAYQKTQAELQPTAHIEAKPQPPSDLNLSEFDGFLSKIMDSCTKDNIQNGKSWIINNSKSPHHCRHIADHLLSTVSAQRSKFSNILHIVYLVNDVGHHCSRKSIPDLQKALGEVVVQVFAIAQHEESPENKERVTKVQKIWETNKIFADDVLERLKDPEKAYEEFEAKLQEAKQLEEQLLLQQQQQQDQKQQDQQTAVSNAMTALGSFGQAPMEFPAQQPPPPNQFAQWQQFPQPFGQFSQIPSQPPPGSFPYQFQPPDQVESIRMDPKQEQKREDLKPLMEIGEQRDGPPEDPPGAQHSDGRNQRFPPEGPPEGFQHQMPPGAIPPFQRGPGAFAPPPGQWGPPGDFNQPPPSFQDPMFRHGPPPGFQQFDYAHQRRPPFPESVGRPQTFDYDHGRADIRPAVPPPDSRDPTVPLAPYYDLPAGLIVPLVKLWDCDYEPLEPTEIRLPVPQPPSERLLASIEAFYSPPSHERPKDSNGWEKNALFEFFKAKLKYIKDKKRNIAVIERSPSPPPLAIVEKPVEVPRPKSRSPRRRSRSASRSPRRRRSLSRSRSRSPRRDRSRSRSRGRSRSRSRSSSGGQGRTARSKTPTRSPSPVSFQKRPRSPTPPTGFVMFESKTTDSKIDESNVGHQLLKKMGWSGKGLGRTGQGIEEPIKGGDIREKSDKFKGVGLSLNDPFDSYRKSKSYTYNRPRSER